MTYRQLQLSDNPQLHALRHSVLRAPLGLNLYDEDLSTEAEQTAFGCFDNDKLVGCLMIVHLANKATAKIRQMAVAKQYQGRGIGATLMLHAEQYLQSKGFLNCILHARLTAVPFYEKLGYQIHGDEFIEVGIPHVLMQKAIGKF